MRTLETVVEWRRSLGLVEAFDTTSFLRAVWDYERDSLALVLQLEDIEFDSTMDSSKSAADWFDEREKQDRALSAKALDACSVVWVSEEMCALVNVAARKIDEERLGGVLPPKPFGYVEFAQPLAVGGDAPISMCLWAVVEGQVFIKEDRGILFGPYVDARLRALWALMPQKVVVEREVRPDRRLWRRLLRAGVTLDLPRLRIVTLRRAKASVEAADGSPVAWSHRWLVDGHWREQWYPSDLQHRPVWISEHVKGPTHLPFVNKRNLYRVVR